MNNKFDLQVELDVPYEKAIEKVTQALKEEGFGVLTEIDVKATLKKKLDVDFRRYVILGACNPGFAYQALQSDLDIGLLLPCNTIVYETDEGKSVVSILSPLTLAEMTNVEGLKSVAKEAQKKLSRVTEKLTAG